MSRSWIHQMAVAGVLFAFWVVLSGRIETRYFVFGAICALGVTLISSRLLYTEESTGSEGERRQVWLSALPWWRLAAYIPWLGVEIVKANIVMIPMILGSRDRLRPRMFKSGTRLRREVSRAALGNSITMTPGTLTVDVSQDGEYLIHAVDEASEQGVHSRRMEKMVGWAFGDPGVEPGASGREGKQ